MDDPQEEVRQVEPELLQGLGDLVVRWGALEHHVSDLFIALTEGNPGSMLVVTTGVSLKTLTEWIRTLLDVYAFEPEMDQEIRETLNEVDALRDERNTLIHGLWTTRSEPGTASVLNLRLDRREIAREVIVTPADLRDLVGHILKVTAELLNLIRRLPGTPES